MINEILWFELLIGCFLLIMLAYTLWGKTGLYAWVAIAIIVANIQVMKTIEFFGFVTSMGNIVYGSLFLVTDILAEVHSKKDAQRAVWIGFFVLISVTLIMQLTLFFVPHESDFLSPHLAAIFSLLPRIAFASLTAYFISQFHDVWIFAKMKKRFKGRFLWVRNNASTMLSQLLDNMIFTLIAFVGVFSWSIILQIFFTSYVMKIVVAACDTPFVYWAKKMRAKH
ncbi:MAG: queuosine precursor transporter [Nanoarchaeota archaeon]|nr:queuosine precursor transporter [Nanoarchaeota archaeon]